MYKNKELNYCIVFSKIEYNDITLYRVTLQDYTGNKATHGSLYSVCPHYFLGGNGTIHG